MQPVSHALLEVKTRGPSSRPALEPLDEYRVLARLGRGGMAEVFLAAKSGSRQLFVLKCIHPEHDEEPALVSMFLDEARLAVRLVHPNIVRAYKIGTLRGRYAIVMEFLEGQPLQRVLRRLAELGQRPSIDLVVALFSQLLDGLHSAHEAKDDGGRLLGVVHRDVSPHNLFLTSEGAPKLLDFGIAKTALQEGRTRTGLLKGKVSYMAPEQARGEPLDRRADVWSLGVVLWETLTGSRLFKADNEAASLHRTLTASVPRASSVRPDVPADLDGILCCALERDLKRRYPNAAAMAADLRAWAARRAIAPANPSQLMTDLFGLYIEKQRAHIALLISQSEAAPVSGSLPSLQTQATSPGTAAGNAAVTHVSTIGETVSALERRHRNTVLVVWALVATVILALGALAFMVVTRADARARVAVPVPVVPRDDDSTRALAATEPGVREPATAPPVTAPESSAAADSPAQAPPAERANKPKRSKSERSAAESPGARPGSTSARSASSGALPAESEVGFLTLDTSPWSNVSVKGSTLGQTPIVRAKLPSGTHTLSLTNPELGLKTSYQVTIEAGKTTVRRIGLE